MLRASTLTLTLIIILILALSLAFSAAQAQAQAQVQEAQEERSADQGALRTLKNQLICQCGCNLVLASCQDMMECGVAQRMTDEIALRLTEGQSPEQIVGSFVARYGKAVLSAPPKRGFDLTAWITPFVALIAGLVVLYFIVRQLVEQGRRRREEALPEPNPELTAEERERFREELQKELKDYL
jgi:cytochrome c-type biogenesis protein CcmH